MSYEEHLAATSSKLQSHFPVVLVSMPWAPPTEPSLGLAILKSALAGAGITSRIYHASTRLLEWITYPTHNLIANSWGCNEFVFTAGLDPKLDDSQLAALWAQADLLAMKSRHTHYSNPEQICDLLLTLRNDTIPKFLNQTADRILDCKPRLVGLTCMFDQTIASVALAKILKERGEGIRIALGGYALEGTPGDVVSRAFPWIDWLVRGDGEEVIVDLAKLSLDNTIEPRRFKAQENTEVLRGKSISLDSSPIPDYDDWLSDTETLKKDHAVTVDSTMLHVESSRGCWWGQAKHCVFCGIDDEAMTYRHKSPGRVMEMLASLRSKYGNGFSFCFSDYIFPKTFYNSLLPELSKVSPKFRLWCEIKANQTSDRVKQFADAGFSGFQPGVESFCTQVLKSMDKGVRAIDNVALLKWAYENRLTVDYNFLFGFPDDQPDSYEAMLRKIPLLYHLTPPVSRTEVVVTRFAPLQLTPERFGLTSPAKHHPCYDLLFSSNFKQGQMFELDEYCYYFERNFEYKPGLLGLYLMIIDVINHWKSQHATRSVWLSYNVNEDRTLTISDARFRQVTEYRLSSAASAIYLQCTNGPLSKTRLESTESLPGPQVEGALNELSERRLLWEEDDLVIGVAVPGELTRERIDSGWTKEWTSIYV